MCMQPFAPMNVKSQQSIPDSREYKPRFLDGSKEQRDEHRERSSYNNVGAAEGLRADT